MFSLHFWKNLESYKTNKYEVMEKNLFKRLDNILNILLGTRLILKPVSDRRSRGIFWIIWICWINKKSLSVKWKNQLISFLHILVGLLLTWKEYIYRYFVLWLMVRLSEYVSTLRAWWELYSQIIQIWFKLKLVITWAGVTTSRPVTNQH